MCRIPAGLLGSNRFTGSSQNYSTLLLEEDAGLLYVGSRGALYALNTTNISTPASPTVSVKIRRSSLLMKKLPPVFPPQVLKEDELIIALSRLSKSHCVPPVFMDIGLNAERVRNSENEVGCSSFFSLPVFFHRSFYISVFLPPVPELTESSLFPPIVCRLIGMLPLNRRSSV